MPSTDERWKEIQELSHEIAYSDHVPSPIESALCGAVVRAREAMSDAARYRWTPVSADYIGRGVAWIDRDATHVCKINERGEKHIMQLPMIEERDK